MSRQNVTVHPAALQRAIDAEADAWAIRTDLAGWIAEISPPGESNREALMRFAKQCFGEGFFEGASSAESGKSLQESLQQGGGKDA